MPAPAASWCRRSCRTKAGRNSSVLANGLNQVTQILLLVAMVYAAAGLILSLAVHLLSFGGIQVGGEPLFFALHVGIFPLWIPVVWISTKLMGGMPRQNSWSFGYSGNYWKPMLSGCPAWMRYMTYGFFIYALVNFAIFIVLAPSGKTFGGSPPAIVWHGFSGHWMAFYSAGLAIVTTAYRRGLANLSPKCSNGHSIVYGDKFCAVCGVPIDEQKS